MPYIIDGHNLIAAMPDIELHEAEDERTLIEHLQPLSNRLRRTMYIYFDQGLAGGRNNFKHGRINVHFSVPPRTADDAIRDHLRSIGKEGPNWVVVSSDREVRAQAKSVGARSMTSEAFINENIQGGTGPLTGDKSDKPELEDLELWEALFREGNDEI